MGHPLTGVPHPPSTASGHEVLVARVLAVSFPDGTTADVDLVLSDGPPADGPTFAAMVFLRDVKGRFAVVYSVRRQEWGPPGGWREPGESVPANAVREVEEETGIRLAEADLHPVGYELFRPHGLGGLWQPGRDRLQAYRAELATAAPPLESALDDTSEREWVSWPELRRRCDTQFWWPLGLAVLRPAEPARG